MNNELTKKSATELESILKKYVKTNEDARNVLIGLQSLIENAKNGQVEVLDSVPFGYAITDGRISLPKDAESAYSKFSLLLKLGEEKYIETMKWAEDRKKRILGGVQ